MKIKRQNSIDLEKHYNFLFVKSNPGIYIYRDVNGREYIVISTGSSYTFLVIENNYYIKMLDNVWDKPEYKFYPM